MGEMTIDNDRIVLVGPGEKATTCKHQEVAASPHVDGGAGAVVSTLKLGSVNVLPAVLAGPIVRRSTPDEICIWICLSCEAKIEACVFTEKPESPLATASITTTAFGERLHAAVVRIRHGSAMFPLDTLLYYTMSFECRNLDGFKGDVAFNPDQLAYGDAKYPALVLPSDTTDTIIIQGSCRKIHAPGEDAMLAADTYLSQHVRPSVRPQQLLFTGDQIYADDVADEVLDVAQAIGPQIMGHDEMLPIMIDQASSAILGRGCGLTTYPAAKIPKHERGNIVRDNGNGFTADPAACVNHSLAFYDFLILYLLAWSADFWGVVARRYPNLWAGLNKYKVHAAGAQRLMANVPTYMMCDDHDVTDDWFIDEKFYKDTMTNPLLKRVMGNAVAAYWLFQGWGNDPELFGGLREDVRRYLVSADGSVGDKLLGPRANWAFVTPAPARVVMLDTRTRRERYLLPKAPGLLNGSALQELAGILRNIHNDAPNHPILMVSPAPVFGYETLETLQRWDATKSREKALEDDFECWAANARCFFELLKTLAASGHRRFAILAGDVHYASTVSVGYDVSALFNSDQVTPPREDFVEVLQLTASAIKNQPDRWHAVQMLFPQTTTSTALKMSGHLDGDKYEDYKGLVYQEKPNVFLNWAFQNLGTYGDVVKENNVGVLSISRNARDAGDAMVTNVYIDPNGKRYQTTGQWKALMQNIHGRASQMSHDDFQKAIRDSNPPGPKF